MLSNKEMSRLIELEEKARNNRLNSGGLYLGECLKGKEQTEYQQLYDKWLV